MNIVQKQKCLIITREMLCNEDIIYFLNKLNHGIDKHATSLQSLQGTFPKNICVRYLIVYGGQDHTLHMNVGERKKQNLLHVFKKMYLMNLEENGTKIRCGSRRAHGYEDVPLTFLTPYLPSFHDNCHSFIYIHLTSFFCFSLLFLFTKEALQFIETVMNLYKSKTCKGMLLI